MLTPILIFQENVCPDSPHSPLLTASITPRATFKPSIPIHKRTAEAP